MATMPLTETPRRGARVSRKRGQLVPAMLFLLPALLGFIAYLANQHYGSGDAWMYETEYVVTMVLGLWMVNVVFSFGHRLLNFQSARVTYFVNASLFIYLVHHPLTLFFGAWIMPGISSNALGFLTGLLFVVGCAILLYEIHLRIPLLRFLFSGKPQQKIAKAPTSGTKC